MINNYGIKGIYRGALPGITGIFFRNGTSFVAMKYVSTKLR